MALALFCYGTLEFPEIMRAVTGRRFAATPAVLDGYACYLIKGASYPGVVAEPGARTAGTLYTGVDARSLQRLNRYEDAPYVRRMLTVRTAHAGDVAAAVYVIPQPRRWMLSPLPWDKRRFERRTLQRYLACLK